jgi:hypothetical protein
MSYVASLCVSSIAANKRPHDLSLPHSHFKLMSNLRLGPRTEGLLIRTVPGRSHDIETILGVLLLLTNNCVISNNMHCTAEHTLMRMVSELM